MLDEPTPVRSQRGLLVDWDDQLDYSWGSGDLSGDEGAEDVGEAEASEGVAGEAESLGAESPVAGEAQSPDSPQSGLAEEPAVASSQRASPALAWLDQGASSQR
eukprot:3373993-Alexandrium_andersonii.AAC.1